MEIPSQDQFKNSGKSQGLSMLDAIGHAKIAVNQMTGLSIDAIAKGERTEDGTWIVLVDVIESVARLGDNDLLSCYEVRIGKGAELLHFARVRRYHREDRDQG